jgi:hypothetical protein
LYYKTEVEHYISNIKRSSIRRRSYSSERLLPLLKFVALFGHRCNKQKKIFLKNSMFSVDAASYVLIGGFERLNL